MCAEAMVIPRLRSSGALSIALYSRKLAYPFSDCRFVMAAVRVVCKRKSGPVNGDLNISHGYLSMVNVADGTFTILAQIKSEIRKENLTDVDMRLGSFEDCRKPSHSMVVLAQNLM